jgi:hypothetical protein
MSEHSETFTDSKTGRDLLSIAYQLKNKDEEISSLKAEIERLHLSLSKYGCTPEQYHHQLDKLWKVLGNPKMDNRDVYQRIVDEIERLKLKFQLKWQTGQPELPKVYLIRYRDNDYASGYKPDLDIYDCRVVPFHLHYGYKNAEWAGPIELPE